MYNQIQNDLKYNYDKIQLPWFCALQCMDVKFILNRFLNMFNTQTISTLAIGMINYCFNTDSNSLLELSSDPWVVPSNDPV